jgi:hypothetical protein
MRYFAASRADAAALGSRYLSEQMAANQSRWRLVAIIPQHLGIGVIGEEFSFIASSIDS